MKKWLLLAAMSSAFMAQGVLGCTSTNTASDPGPYCVYVSNGTNGSISSVEFKFTDGNSYNVERTIEQQDSYVYQFDANTDSPSALKNFNFKVKLSSTVEYTCNIQKDGNSLTSDDASLTFALTQSENSDASVALSISGDTRYISMSYSCSKQDKD